MLFGKSPVPRQQYFRFAYLLPTALLALAVTPYFVGLGASSLWDSNEAFYAVTPREMIEAGDYLNPTFNYQPRFNKPPLCYWVVAAFYKLFGASEAVERLPIALGALIIVVAAFLLGRRVFSTEAGLYAALALATTPRFLMFSRRIIIDVYLAMFIGLALLMFVLAETEPKRRRLYLLLMYACVGLAVLTKGPIGIVLPAMVIAIYLGINRRLARVCEMMVPAGALIVIAIVLPWYIWVYVEHGWSYIETFLLKDNLSRYTQPVWGPQRGLLFYIPVVIGDLFPWSIFLLPVVWTTVKRLKRFLWHRDRSRGLANSGDRYSEGSSQLSKLLLIWIIVIVTFFSLSRSKEDLYILPIYPAVAALVGFSLARFRVATESLHVFSAAVTGALVTLAGAIVILVAIRGSVPYEIEGIRLIGFVALVGGVSTVGSAVMRNARGVAASLAAAMILVNWVFVTVLLPSFEKYKPVRAICEIIEARAAPNAAVGYFRFASPSMVFYLKRRIFEYYQLSELQATFSSSGEVYCLMTEEDFQWTKDEMSVPIYVLARQPVFRVKLRSVFERVDTPQVVLISNRPGVNISE